MKKSYDSKNPDLLLKEAAEGLDADFYKDDEPEEDLEFEIEDKDGNMYMIPKIMVPDVEHFEKIGFRFYEIGDNVRFQTKLPEGCSIENGDHYWTKIFDEKNRERAFFCYNSDSKKRKGTTYLKHRFEISQKIKNDEIKICVKDFDGKVLYNVGTCSNKYSYERYAFEQKAEDFLNENFPDWKDPNSYWELDDPKAYIKARKKK